MAALPAPMGPTSPSLRTSLLMPLTHGLVNRNRNDAVSPDLVVSSALLWHPWCVAAPGPPTSQMSSALCPSAEHGVVGRLDGHARPWQLSHAVPGLREHRERAWDLCRQVFVISPLPVTSESDFSQPHAASCPPVLLSLQGDDGPDVRGGSGDILLVHATETDRKGMAAPSQWPRLCQKAPPLLRPLMSSPLPCPILSSPPALSRSDGGAAGSHRESPPSGTSEPCSEPGLCFSAPVASVLCWCKAVMTPGTHISWRGQVSRAESAPSGLCRRPLSNDALVVIVRDLVGSLLCSSWCLTQDFLQTAGWTPFMHFTGRRLGSVFSLQEPAVLQQGRRHHGPGFSTLSVLIL